MNASTFVFELGCEELPSSSLTHLNQQFKNLFEEQLELNQLGFDGLSAIAAPRRLGVIIENIQDVSKPRAFERKGPALASAWENGEPTKALEGFCRGLGISVEDTTITETEKGQWVVFFGLEPGRPAREVLSDVCANVVSALVFSKVMRWGIGREEFPRPVKWILALLGKDIVPLSLYGLSADRLSYGHRFHAPELIEVPVAQRYSELLHGAFVIHDFDKRKLACWNSILTVADEHGVNVEEDDALLTEISCLVEWPIGLCGEFDTRFLIVPEIALIAAMKGHQKYFHTRDEKGSLCNRFITVSNIESADTKKVIDGNQRVIHARLSDAEFFFEQDCKRTLADRRLELNAITFHPKLGSLGAKTERLAILVSELAVDRKLNENAASRAAELSRCDLVCEMVLEFTELQGRIGSIYALKDGEDHETALAIEGLYQPNGINDRLPATALGHLLALSDRIDTLTGLFGINQPPTGSKDPFALRRAANGCIRLNEHPDLQIDLAPWIKRAAVLQPFYNDDQGSPLVIQFIKERERSRLASFGVRHDIISAVQMDAGLFTFSTRLKAEALQKFSIHPDFDALIGFNKRVANLIKEEKVTLVEINPALFISDLEAKLFSALEGVANDYEDAISRETYEAALTLLLSLKPYIDDFLDGVMINVEEAEIRANRLSLGAKVRGMFLRFADLSPIQS